MSRYVLDTSALLAFIENEDESEKIEALISNAIDGKDELIISTVTCIEIFYISLREQGSEIASERLEQLETLPIAQAPLNPQLTKVIGEIKANYSMSFADACIAGLAKAENAILVHKDPEFEQVQGLINQLILKYKKSSKQK